MSFSYSKLLDSVSALPGTHDNSLLGEKVKICMTRLHDEMAPVFYAEPTGSTSTHVRAVTVGETRN